jgi:NAD-dependent DNA ligase
MGHTYPITCPAGIHCPQRTLEHTQQFSHPDEWLYRLSQGHLHERESIIPGPQASTEFIDEEGFSDDDEMPTENEWIQAARKENQVLPQSLKYLRVASTGTFSCQVGFEIESRGGNYVKMVDSSVHLLVAPHRLPRSTKAATARKLGIPIIDEVYLLSIQPVQSTTNW